MATEGVEDKKRTGRVPGPLRLAFTRAVQDWWYELIPFSVLNLLWVVLVVTVVAGPPATAAMMGVARDAANGEGCEPRNYFVYIRRYFWRSWALGLVTLVGTFIFVIDIRMYANLVPGNPLVQTTGMWVLFYILVIWLVLVLVAWALLVNHPQMRIRDVVRNALVFTLRLPGANLGLGLMVLVLTILFTAITIGVSLALAALVCLLVQHYLYIQAPVLANFPPKPGQNAPVPAGE